jgi:hypothetical protein
MGFDMKRVSLPSVILRMAFSAWPPGMTRAEMNMLLSNTLHPLRYLRRSFSVRIPFFLALDRNPDL